MIINKEYWVAISHLKEKLYYPEAPHKNDFGLYIFADMKSIEDFFSDINDLTEEIDPNDYTTSLILGDRTKKQFRKLVTSNKYTHFKKLDMNILNL